MRSPRFSPRAPPQRPELLYPAADCELLLPAAHRRLHRLLRRHPPRRATSASSSAPTIRSCPTTSGSPSATTAAASSIRPSGHACPPPQRPAQTPRRARPHLRPHPQASTSNSNSASGSAPATPSASPSRSTDAADHIAGFCLLNDWSARDIQSWEYQPLGPFLAKSFHTTISPWIVTPEALAPFRQPATPSPLCRPQPPPLPLHAADQQTGALNLDLEVFLPHPAMRDRDMPPHRLSRSNAEHLYWTPAQLLTHHASTAATSAPATSSAPEPSPPRPAKARLPPGTHPLRRANPSPSHPANTAASSKTATKSSFAPTPSAKASSLSASANAPLPSPVCLQHDLTPGEADAPANPSGPLAALPSPPALPPPTIPPLRPPAKPVLRLHSARYAAAAPLVAPAPHPRSQDTYKPLPRPEPWAYEPAQPALPPAPPRAPVPRHCILIRGPLRRALPKLQPALAPRNPQTQSWHAVQREQLPVIALRRMRPLMIQHHLERQRIQPTLTHQPLRDENKWTQQPHQRNANRRTARHHHRRLPRARPRSIRPSPASPSEAQRPHRHLNPAHHPHTPPHIHPTRQQHAKPTHVFRSEVRLAPHIFGNQKKPGQQQSDRNRRQLHGVQRSLPLPHRERFGNAEHHRSGHPQHNLHRHLKQPQRHPDQAHHPQPIRESHREPSFPCNCEAACSSRAARIFRSSWSSRAVSYWCTASTRHDSRMSAGSPESQKNRRIIPSAR